MVSRLFLPIGLLGMALAAAAGYQWARAQVAQDIYRDRLVVLQDDYLALAERYNQAITPRPVTELLVEDGIVCVLVRQGNGELARIQTPFNAWEDELFVDYALVDGRLLIRRVFDEHTAARSDQTVVVDSDLLEVDWTDPTIPYGKAIYRSKMTDGRWVVSVTGDGSLGLKRVGDDEPVVLETQPKVQAFDPIEETADRDIQTIGIGDVWKHLVD